MKRLIVFASLIVVMVSLSADAFAYQRDTVTPVPVVLEENEINTAMAVDQVFGDEFGVMYLAVYNTIVRNSKVIWFDTANPQVTIGIDFFNQQRINALEVRNENGQIDLFAGTNDGVYVLVGTTWHQILFDKVVRDIHYDSPTDQLYIATGNGLFEVPVGSYSWGIPLYNYSCNSVAIWGSDVYVADSSTIYCLRNGDEELVHFGAEIQDISIDVRSSLVRGSKPIVVGTTVGTTQSWLRYSSYFMWTKDWSKLFSGDPVVEVVGVGQDIYFATKTEVYISQHVVGNLALTTSDLAINDLTGLVYGAYHVDMEYTSKGGDLHIVATSERGAAYLSTRYRIPRYGVTCTVFEEPQESGLLGTATINRLYPQTRYYVGVFYLTETERSRVSNVFVVTTTEDSTPPSVVEKFRVGWYEGGDDCLAFTWIPQDDRDVYEILINGQSAWIGASGGRVILCGWTGTFIYDAQIRVFDEGGNESEIYGFSYAWPGEEGYFGLSWRPNSEDDIWGYGIYIDYALSATTRGLSHFIYGLEGGRRYRVTMDARDKCKNKSEESDPMYLMPFSMP